MILFTNRVAKINLIQEMKKMRTETEYQTSIRPVGW